MIRQRNPEDPRYKIDRTKKVFVYKNLHQDCWSIKQDGLVKVHATEINLYNCNFKINTKGRKRVLKEKKKNVHAGICGYIVHPEPEYACWDDCSDDSLDEITYNPYKNTSFVNKLNEPRWFSCLTRFKPHKVLIST